MPIFNLSCIPGFIIISTFSQIRHRNYGLEHLAYILRFEPLVFLKLTSQPNIATKIYLVNLDFTPKNSD